MHFSEMKTRFARQVTDTSNRHYPVSEIEASTALCTLKTV